MPLEICFQLEELCFCFVFIEYSWFNAMLISAVQQSDSVIHTYVCVCIYIHTYIYYMTSLVAQMAKHLPTMQETWVQSLGWEDFLEKEMETHSSILAWKIPWMEELVSYSPWGHNESDMTEWLHFTHYILYIFFSIMAYHRVLNIVLCAIQGPSHSFST